MVMDRRSLLRLSRAGAAVAAAHMTEALRPGMYARLSVAETHFPKVAPSVIANATTTFFSSGTAIPTNPIISDDEWTRVMPLEMGGSIRSPLPSDGMVDNSFVLKATTPFGVA